MPVCLRKMPYIILGEWQTLGAWLALQNALAARAAHAAALFYEGNGVCAFILLRKILGYLISRVVWKVICGHSSMMRESFHSLVESMARQSSPS